MHQIVITRLSETDYRIITFGNKTVESEEVIVRELLGMRLSELAARLDTHDTLRSLRYNDAG